MREFGRSVARRGVGWRRTIAALGLASVFTMANDGWALAPTLSGLPAAPYGERLLRVTSAGTGLRFRAPTGGDLAAVHLLWRRGGDACRVTLFADGPDGPGAELAAAEVTTAEGWVAAPLSASLTAGATYHVLASCPEGSAARLGIVMDADPTALASGAWRVEEMRSSGVRLRRAPASPLFALSFTDGRWWGQPYRGRGKRPLVRLCGSNEVRQTIVSRDSMIVDGVELPRTREAVAPGISYSLGGAEAGAEVQLAAGAAYTLHLAAPGSGGCYRVRGLVTDLAHGPSLGGLDAMNLRLSADGGTSWSAHPEARLGVSLRKKGGGSGGGGGGGGGETPAVCGDGALAAGEECDGASGASCPDRCTDTCTCAPPPSTCGDGVVNAEGEACDGGDDGACPGRCTTECACQAPPARSYKSAYGGGYFGHYDGASGPTVSEWPKKLRLLQGSAWGEGPLVANAKQVALAAGNTDARFLFYQSLALVDPACGCFDSAFYQSFASSHPEWLLRDGSGNRVTKGREYAVDIGNPAFIDAWLAWAFTAMDRYGWDGVWIDNVLRGNFAGWNTVPVNPRTRARYTMAEYRRDMLAALQRMRNALDARGKIMIGNQSSAWVPDTFVDPIVQEQIKTMHGIRLEDCIYNYNGDAYGESDWIAQLRYLDFANRHGVFTQCQGVSGTIRDPSKRGFILSSYLLSKEGFSDVSELNTVDSWWSGLTVDLGAPSGGFACLDPAAGYAESGNCPSTGKVYVREWTRGRVVVNPSSTTRTVPLGGTFVLNGSPVTQVTLGPRSGAVLLRP